MPKFMLAASFFLVVTAQTNNCSHLETTKMKFHGSDVGALLKSVCEFWPDTFPVETANEAADLLNATFGEGGTYDKAKRTADEQKKTGDFCWVRNVVRPSVVPPKGYQCPKQIDEVWEHETPRDVKPVVGQDGHQYCEKNCSDICGDWENRGEVSKGLCGCRSTEPEVVGTAGPIWVYKEEPRVVLASPAGCPYVQGADCFGECPNHATPTWVIGDFRPVCSSPCGGNYGIECGFACANSTQSCVKSVTDQVGEVCRAVGLAAGFFTADYEIAVATDAIVNLVEFAVGALSALVGQVMTAWKDSRQKYQEVGLVAAIMQVVEETKKHIPTDKKQWAKTGVLLAQIIAILKGWHGWHMHSSIADISAVFLNQGGGVVIDAFNILGAFQRPKCPEVDALESILV